jgi:hypothetical protein
MRTAFSAGGGESEYCFAGEALVVAQIGEVPVRDEHQKRLSARPVASDA